MTDKMRWRYGDTNPVVAAVDAATVIDLGDLVWQDTDDAKPAAAVVDNLPQPHDGVMFDCQDAFKRSFLGVAMQRSRSGESASIRVATTGVFEFDCNPDCFELGDYVCPAPNLPTTDLLTQKVVKCQEQYAIGRVAKRSGVPIESVLVDILSTVMTGGV
jgi:hypothetical protein